VTNPITRRQAEAFAKGYEKGRSAGIVHVENVASKKLKRVKYLEQRVARLARWRRFAIDRLLIGRVIVTEIDRDSKANTGTAHEDR
jgi:hypothetical protein